MPETVNIHAAKTQLSKLVERAAAGEEIILARAGKPMARLVPLARTVTVRKPGLLRGRIRVADDFDGPMPEEWLQAFYTGELEPPEGR
jgi:prevent-host-death family protein